MNVYCVYLVDKDNIYVDADEVQEKDGRFYFMNHKDNQKCIVAVFVIANIKGYKQES